MTTIDGAQITGTRPELWAIFDRWLIGNEGRETTDQSFGLDYGQELLDEWFKAHDAEVRREALREAADLSVAAYAGVSNTSGMSYEDAAAWQKAEDIEAAIRTLAEGEATQ